MSYEKENSSGFVSSASASAMIAAALAPYLTSASASAALSAYITSVSASAAIALGSACLLLGNMNTSGLTSLAFSGSWSDIAVLQLKIITRLQAGATSATVSIAISTDGGATTFLSMNSSATLSAGQQTMHDFTVMGGNNKLSKIIQEITAQVGSINKFAATATLSLGFINHIKYGSSATMAGGFAYLYGFKDA